MPVHVGAAAPGVQCTILSTATYFDSVTPTAVKLAATLPVVGPHHVFSSFLVLVLTHTQTVDRLQSRRLILCGARYRELTRRYLKLSLAEERRLIASAQSGSGQSREELVLRHIGFVVFRLHRKVFPNFLRRFGDDLLAEAIPVLYAKIQTYNLAYRDKDGRPKPVKFVSYIWKRIDGFIVDSLKKELRKDRLLGELREGDGCLSGSEDGERFEDFQCQFGLRRSTEGSIFV